MQGAASLLIDDARTADDVLDAVLARLCASRVPPEAIRTRALTALVGTDRPALLPGAGRPAFELVDRTPDVGRPTLVTALAALPRRPRAVIVLQHLCGLSHTEIAAMLDTDPIQVAELSAQASETLLRAVPPGPGEESLSDQLRAAVPYDRRTSRVGARDVANSHRLVGHRRRRRVGLGVAAALALILLGPQLQPQAEPELTPVAGSTPYRLPTFSPTPQPEPPCDTAERACQMKVVRDWEASTAKIIGSYLDPDHTYFSVYSTADGTLSQPDIWLANGGALALDLVRVDRGSTKVTVQIATSDRYATSCGSTTKIRCVSMRFMDGNRFTLTETSRANEGIEVQFSPDGTQVVTAIARNTGVGRPLDVDRGQLIQLVQDSRMRLPAR